MATRKTKSRVLVIGFFLFFVIAVIAIINLREPDHRYDHERPEGEEGSEEMIEGAKPDPYDRAGQPESSSLPTTRAHARA